MPPLSQLDLCLLEGGSVLVLSPSLPPHPPNAHTSQQRAGTVQGKRAKETVWMATSQSMFLPDISWGIRSQRDLSQMLAGNLIISGENQDSFKAK